jgi:hypothetical protein
MAFLFTMPNPGFEAFLKFEMQHFHPDWRLAFSAPGFITYKADDGVKWADPWFSKLSGECLGQGEAGSGEVAYKVKDQNWRLKPFKNQLMWPDITATEPVPFNPEAPSRAYLKMAESHELLKIPFKAGERVVEWGAAPGGITFYLLGLGLKVDSVEPGEMKITHPNFTHLKMSLQKFEAREKYDWLVCDVNLHMQIIIDELAKKEAKFFKELKGFWITIKLNQPEQVKKIPHWSTFFRERGLKTKVYLLPSHHQEILLFATAI